MNYRLVVRRPAKADVRSAARRYELQRPGLGREFVTEVDAALSRVADNPTGSGIGIAGRQAVDASGVRPRRVAGRL